MYAKSPRLPWCTSFPPAKGTSSRTFATPKTPSCFASLPSAWWRTAAKARPPSASDSRKSFGRFSSELAVFERACGKALVAWFDGRWTTLRKATYARKKISQFVDDQEVGTFLYDEGLKFGTNYPISEKSLAGRLKQAQSVLDHLQKKWDQDKKKIPQP
jgi:uncharacterized protein YbdZ (MbtH family)